VGLSLPFAFDRETEKRATEAAAPPFGAAFLSLTAMYVLQYARLLSIARLAQSVERQTLILP
jgi:hypothetical protein